MIGSNFGLTGQRGDDYDYLFCGKRCKARKKVRLEKKKLKNEEKKASIERARAETKIMTQTFGSQPQVSQVSPLLTSQVSGKTSQAGFGGSTMMIVLGVLVIGGFLLFQNKQAPQLQVRPKVNPIPTHQ